MLGVWVYVLDTFKPLDIEFSKLMELVDKDPLQLFNSYVRDVIEEEPGSINNVKVYDVYFDFRRLELLVEYIVKCDLGEISVKLIYSKSLKETLIHYYRYEK